MDPFQSKYSIENGGDSQHVIKQVHDYDLVEELEPSMFGNQYEAVKNG